MRGGAGNGTVNAKGQLLRWQGEKRRAEKAVLQWVSMSVFKPERQKQLFCMLSKHFRLRSPSSPDTAGAGGPCPAPVVPAEAQRLTLEPSALARLAELDPKGENRLIERVLKAFQTSAARLMPQLEAARLADDLSSIRLVAHTFKSSSASIGALTLSQLCAQLEDDIRTEAGNDLEPGINAVVAELGVVLEAIAQRLEARP